ncbi:MAG: sigma-54-dependent Fis family transcriptional regulator [Spirochaetales bacterium]|nr:sigma-54-dependent Fis family transcriptional regulator [Spirochaetales bacterium]
MKRKILVCDDEENVRTFLRDLLSLEGYEVIEAATGGQALEVVAREKPDLCVLDLMLPDGSGVDLLPAFKTKLPQLAVIVITALGTVDNAVLSMKAGAYDFITKPFDVDTILISVRRALDYISVSRENTVLWNLNKNRQYFEDFIGECPAIQGIKNLIPKLAFADVPILISGETGTGKNVLAKQIHYTLSGAQAPLVYTNCSSIPAALFESELFGHEKGSYTGATAQKKGRVELADGGTLLLDEITEIPYELQAKLLDFLQERACYRVGGVAPISVQARIIALTNKSLPEEIQAGRFRKDLFYRLNVIHFTVPPLRERGDDIARVCDYLVALLRRKYDAPNLRISDSAMDLIRSYAWPGNVRELKNALERAFIYADGDELDEASLVLDEPDHTSRARELRVLVDECERDIILRRLAFFKGNRTATAQDLDISIRTLQYKLEKYDIR